VPGAIFLGHGLTRDNALAGNELEHLVEEKKGIAVRKDLLDLMFAEVGRHGLTLVAVSLPPDVVQPRLLGTFGRTYYYAVETPSTQELPPEDAPHGAVALAEHQTAGRGRRDRVWIDAPGSGLTFSVVLVPPSPVKRWPELTIVAAEAIAGAIGPGASIKEPNDVLLDGAKVAGVLAQASLPARVVLGIGVNVGVAPWEGAAAADADRLELLVEILDRLERGYEAWVREQSERV
jgi:BirA family transcriptional regulator, biotin operon repressor / biotin---[acetyl-CoA-carboxylase] ligase